MEEWWGFVALILGSNFLSTIAGALISARISRAQLGEARELRISDAGQKVSKLILEHNEEIRADFETAREQANLARKRVQELEDKLYKEIDRGKEMEKRIADLELENKELKLKVGNLLDRILKAEGKNGNSRDTIG